MVDSPSSSRKVVVAIGSKNPAKTMGTKKAFSRFFQGVEVREVDVSSQVRAQPMTLQETVAGARARAAMALLSSGRGGEGVDFGVGVEAGIMSLGVESAGGTIAGGAEQKKKEEKRGGEGEEEEGESLNLQFAAVADSTGRIHYGCSSGFPLPSRLVARMRGDGHELDAYAHELTGVPKILEQDGIIYHLSKKNLSRVEMTEQCVSMALLPWVNGKAYGLRKTPDGEGGV
jgi:non-canonical (house-cleaning) NTP pyrophosphatase